VFVAHKTCHHLLVFSSPQQSVLLCPTDEAQGCRAFCCCFSCLVLFFFLGRAAAGGGGGGLGG